MKLVPTKILVPTDFSSASVRALALARELAAGFDAEIHLLHARVVVDDFVVDSKILDEIESILALSESETRRALEQAGQDGPARVHAHISQGTAPADAIIDAVSTYRCDLVIMGTHGRRGLKGLLLGSVAKEVVHRSPAPVLTTRADAKGVSTLRKILVAHDFSEASLGGIHATADWARRLSANVTLLHVVEYPVYPEFYTLQYPREEYLERCTRKSHEHLARIAEEHLTGVPYETAVIHAPAAEGIAEFAAINNFDLVVLATRGLAGVTHGSFGSVAERVTQLSEVPVLTVRNPPQPPTQTSKRKRKLAKVPKRSLPNRDRGPSFSVERTPARTVLKFHPRQSLAGEDLQLLHGVWDFFDHERRAPSRVLVVLAPPDLLSPQSLERLLGGSSATGTPTATEISDRILREENVIQRFIEHVRGLNSFVVGVVGGEIAFQLAGPLLACDYRITSSDSVFVNTTQTLPRAPLASLPWLLARMVGAAKASQILLDVPRLPADAAHELGLVNHVTAPGRLEAGALEVADRLGSLPRATLVSLKRAIIASGEDFQTYQQQELALTHRLASACWKDEHGEPLENHRTPLRGPDRPGVR
jgi:nucleotide-binding universal stress UspA family protein/enoyl-CoA hydratase/carnithine racemase